MKKSRFGEVRTRKKMFPSDAKELADRGSLGIVISQCKVSQKTKDILDGANITLYEGVEPELVEKIREQIHEKEQKEKEKE